MRRLLVLRILVWALLTGMVAGLVVALSYVSGAKSLLPGALVVCLLQTPPVSATWVLAVRWVK